MKALIWNRKSNLFKALGHPSRVRILELLGVEERCVCELIEALDLEQSNVSQHLAVLRRENIIEARKQGLQVMYRIKHLEVLTILAKAQEMINHELEHNARLMEELRTQS
ncbi:MAG: ArsR/SmtB family transcription factor [Desulfitobacteriaceae bacterium]